MIKNIKNEILVPISVGELIDKISILKIKKKKNLSGVFKLPVVLAKLPQRRPRAARFIINTTVETVCNYHNYL